MGDADDSYDFTDLDAVHRGAARRRRPGDGQPVQGRHRAGRDAGGCTATSATRCSRSSAGSSSAARSATSTAACADSAATGVLDLDCTPPAWSSPARWWSRRRSPATKIARGADHAGKDGRSRAPHLRTWRDGWRHLRFLLLFSPRWLFFIPGGVTLLLGLIIGAMTATGPITIGRVTFDVDTLVGGRRDGDHRLSVGPVLAVYPGLRPYRRLPSRTRRRQRRSSPGSPWNACSSWAVSLGLPGWQA